MSRGPIRGWHRGWAVRWQDVMALVLKRITLIKTAGEQDNCHKVNSIGLASAGPAHNGWLESRRSRAESFLRKKWQATRTAKTTSVK
jgi:hypothetical protein